MNIQMMLADMPRYTPGKDKGGKPQEKGEKIDSQEELIAFMAMHQDKFKGR